MNQMKNNNQLIIGLVIGFFIGLLVIKACNTTSIKEPVITSTKEIKQEIIKEEDHTDELISVLDGDINKLNKKSSLLKDSLVKYKEYMSELDLQNETLRINFQEMEQEYSENFYDAVTDYISNNSEKDTVCKKTIQNLEEQVLIKDSIIFKKDSIIVIKDSLNSKYKNYLTLSLNQQNKLLDYSKQLKKEITKQKTNNILWKAGTIIVAGLIIKQQLKK